MQKHVVELYLYSYVYKTIYGCNRFSLTSICKGVLEYMLFLSCLLVFISNSSSLIFTFYYDMHVPTSLASIQLYPFIYNCTDFTVRCVVCRVYSKCTWNMFVAKANNIDALCLVFGLDLASRIKCYTFRIVISVKCYLTIKVLTLHIQCIIVCFANMRAVM